MASDMKECVNILYELRSGKRHGTLEIREKYRQDQVFLYFGAFKATFILFGIHFQTLDCIWNSS